MTPPDHAPENERVEIRIKMMQTFTNSSDGVGIHELFEQLGLPWNEGEQVLLDLLRHGFAKFKFGDRTTRHQLTRQKNGGHAGVIAGWPRELSECVEVMASALAMGRRGRLHLSADS